jgi:CRP-like cAMP-binding protein
VLPVEESPQVQAARLESVDPPTVSIYLCPWAYPFSLLQQGFGFSETSRKDTLFLSINNFRLYLIICSGRIEIKKETEYKGNNVVVASYSSGAVVGALGILDGRPRAATATAPEDVSLLVITRESFEALIENNPAIGTKLLKGLLLSVSMRLRMSFERLITFF